MELLTDPQAWISFITLVFLELVLGVDNVIFISIMAGRLPKDNQANARRMGLAFAVISRIILLFSLKWVMGLTKSLFVAWGHDISGKDVILIVGGLFLIFKSTHEIHQKLEGEEGHASAKAGTSFVSFLLQVMILDVVFSLDSVITAVGMADHLSIMIAAVIIASLVMIVSADVIGNFVDRHPTVKMLALSFLLLIGFNLIVEGLDYHIPKGYVYFAMGFSVMVEALNLQLRKPAPPVKLHEPYTGPKKPS